MIRSTSHRRRSGLRPRHVPPPGRRRRGRARRGFAALVLVVTMPLVGPGASGQVPPTSDAPPGGAAALDAVLADERLSPPLRGFSVTGDGYARAYDAWAGTLRQITEAHEELTRSNARLIEIERRRAEVRDELDERRVLLRGAAFEREGLDIAMHQLAVSSYVRGGPTADAAKMFDVGDVTDELYARALERDVAADQIRRRNALRGEVERLQIEITDRTGTLGDLAAQASDTAGAAHAANQRADRLSARVPALESALRDARLSAFVAGTDVPLIALDAYVRAAATFAAEKPQCALDWTMIAALGRIESHHGNINGATLRPDGRTTVRIIGIGLTGENGTALVPDTDGGRLDGDPVLDRAVGPMQFIPSTWAMYARDGNRDGVADPQNIYDAAMAAAAFLCSSGRSLADVANLRAAYLAYNRSTSYVNTGVANVQLYRTLTFPPAP